MVGEGLEGHTTALLVLAHQDRQPAQLVPGGDDLPLVGEDEQGHGALDFVLGVEDTGHQIIFLIDEGRGQLSSVDLAGAHGHKLMSVVGEILLDQLLGIVDDAHGGDGVQA